LVLQLNRFGSEPLRIIPDGSTSRGESRRHRFGFQRFLHANIDLVLKLLPFRQKTIAGKVERPMFVFRRYADRVARGIFATVTGQGQCLSMH
jgi:hypothetical protein